MWSATGLQAKHWCENDCPGSQGNEHSNLFTFLNRFFSFVCYWPHNCYTAGSKISDNNIHDTTIL